MNKQEAIIKAYGSMWGLVESLTPKSKSNTDNFDLHENGYFKLKRLKLQLGSKYDYFPESDFEHENGYVRPYSLRGLSSNNGWTKIESEKDLPKSYGFFLFVIREIGRHERNEYRGLFKKQIVQHYSHWRNIEIVPDPIY